jgi:hypothetical protein
LPGRAFGLHGQQLGDGVAPALGSAAPVGRWAIADPGRRGLGFEACAVAGLSIGAAEGVFALGGDGLVA